MTSSLVVAIVFSTGKNGATRLRGPASTKRRTSTATRIFVCHAPSPSRAANGEFDDQFAWITVGELYGRLIAAGVLP